MSTRITQHFFNDVFPSYIDYVAVKKQHTSGDDLRKGIQAATSIYHFREILPSPFNDKTKIHKLCPDYHILSEAVNAAKHHNRNAKNALILSSENIRMIEVRTIFDDPFGSYFHEEKEVALFLNNGIVRDLYEVMTNVLNTWFVILAQLDLAPYSSPIDIARTCFVSKEQAKKVLIRPTLTYYTPVVTETRYLRYNYITRQAEPLDEFEHQITEMRVEMVRNGCVRVVTKANGPVEVRLEKTG